MRDRRQLTHLCCRPCRVRFAPSTTHATCPRCHGALSSLAPPEAMGYALSAPASPQWQPADLHALARAVEATIVRAGSET